MMKKISLFLAASLLALWACPQADAAGKPTNEQADSNIADTRTLAQFREEPQNVQIALVAYWVAVRSSDKLPQAVRRGEFSDALLSVHECMALEEDAGRNAREAAAACMEKHQDKFGWMRIKK